MLVVSGSLISWSLSPNVSETLTVLHNPSWLLRITICLSVGIKKHLAKAPVTRIRVVSCNSINFSGSLYMLLPELFGKNL